MVHSRVWRSLGGLTEDRYDWDERVETWEDVAASDAFLAIRDRVVTMARRPVITATARTGQPSSVR
jgi:hypothetical protein